MNDTSAFILTKNFAEAMDLFHAEQARYAAELEDGRGFVAISDVPAARAFGLVSWGELWLEIPSDPADPRWEELIRGPKRKRPRGNERFAMLRPTKSAFALYREICEWPDLQGASIVTCNLEPRVLIEFTDGTPPLACEWNLAAVDYIDSREKVDA